MININHDIQFFESRGLLYFRLLKLINSIRRVSEAIVELIIDIILFLSSLFIWLSRFNNYILDFVKYLINLTLRLSELITLKSKIYILIGIILIYLLYYLVSKIHNLLIIGKKQYNTKWSIIINYLLYLLSPYFIFIFMIYLPLCIFIPKYYFENIIIKLWIYWLPLNKIIITLYYSLYNSNDFENENNYKSRLNKIILICEKFTDTSYILYLLQSISNKINNHKLNKIKKDKSLMLLNSKSHIANEIILIKKLQCWIDYFNLWLIFYLLKNYIFGNTLKVILNFIINHLKNFNLFAFCFIDNFSLSDIKFIKIIISFKFVSLILFFFKIISKIPASITKILILLIININWKYLLISIITLNTLLEVKYIETNDNQFSIIIEESNISFKMNNKDENSDDEINEDFQDDYDNESFIENEDQNSKLDSQEFDHLYIEDDASYELTEINNSKINKFQLILYEYPSLNLLIRSYLISIIDFVTINILGITLFTHIHYQNDNYSHTQSINLNSKSLTRSLPSIKKENLINRKLTNSPLLHSKTMPELKINMKNNKDRNQLKVISNLLENNLILYWLPDSWKNYYLYIGEKLINKSNKFKNWILYAVILFSQIPQWIILIFPSFIVNLVGCIIFGFIYPLIMVLRTNSIIGPNYQLNSKTTQKIQTWALYYILFNFLNEIFLTYHIYFINIIYWIPFRIHIFYLIILILQLFSSIIPIIIK